MKLICIGFQAGVLKHEASTHDEIRQLMLKDLYEVGNLGLELLNKDTRLPKFDVHGKKQQETIVTLNLCSFLE